MPRAPRRKNAYLESDAAHLDLVYRRLCDVLCCLRAQRISYQNSHWQVSGNDYYGNHLLLMRLYEGEDDDSPLDDQIDTLAEKMVGYLGAGAIRPSSQADKIAWFVRRWSQVECPLRRGLQSERDLQVLLKRAYGDIEKSGAMTLGLDDWIMATANDHEKNEYLLQQSVSRSNGVSKLSKLRAPSPVAPDAADVFFDNPMFRETLEFARSKAVTNDFGVAAEAAPELDVSLRKEMKMVNRSPPTPQEIVQEPGGDQFSTLTRLVVDSEDTTKKVGRSSLGWSFAPGLR